MYAIGTNVPSDPDQLNRFLTEELNRISEVFQALASGQCYPHSKASAKRQYWDDYTSSFNAGRITGANQPSFNSFVGGTKAFSFDPATMNEIFLAPIHILHTYKPGTAIYPHIHWSPGGVNTGVVRWGVEYTVAKGHGQQSFPATNTIYLEQAASGTQYKHQLIEASDGQAFSTDLEPDSLLICRVFRDAAHANDTCTDPVFGLQMDIHFQKSFWATKQKTPDFYK